MRTGEGGARIAEGRNYNANKPRSGFQAACLPWLHERGVAMLAPTSPRTRPRPATARCTCRSTWSASWPWACGSSTTASSRTSPRTCDRLGRWEFQFALAPIRFQGVTGSPVNPLAVF